MWRHLVDVLKGESQTLCYTSSLLHTLGSVTVSNIGLNDLGKDLIAISIVIIFCKFNSELH